VSTRRAAGGEEVRLRVRVQPGASRSKIVGERDGVLVVRLTAPPIEGKANEALRRLLARQLRVPRSGVEIVRGAKSRDKLVQIKGMTEKALREALR
jgi:uncharacterized protein (TIGR00251 family)